MAAKLGRLIGSEITTTFCFSITKHTTSTSLSTLNTTPTISATTRTKYPHIARRQTAVAPPVQATSRPSSNDPDSNEPSTFQDNLIYLVKGVIGSFLGAALIKYGSAAVPSITRPDITIALLMISTPPVIAMLLLAIASQKD